MIKVFVSHSSAQKKFAQELVDELGRDRCYIDCYDFNPAYRTIDEIYSKIECSTYFVLLVSKESLESDWVNLEIEKAVHTFHSGTHDMFLPYVIDDSVRIPEDIPDWMAKERCYNLRLFRSAKMLAKDIEEKCRRIIWNENPRMKALDTIFVGRNNKVEEFQSIILSPTGKHVRLLVTSGRAGIGKESFAKKCMRENGKDVSYEPYRISLTRKSSIEDFIVHLNTIACLYDEVGVSDILRGSMDAKVDASVRLLDFIYGMNEVVFVDDSMSGVLPNGNIADWLRSVVCHPNLPKHLGLYFQSLITPSHRAVGGVEQIANISLQPLDRKDREKLLFMYAKSYGLDSLSEDAARTAVSRLLYSPNQLHEFVKIAKLHGMERALRDIESLQNIGDKKARETLSLFHKEEKRSLLILLSRFDFLSHSVLSKVYEERYSDILEVLDELQDYGLIEQFGVANENVRLDTYMADYIQRNKLSLPQDLENHLHDVLEQSIAEAAYITGDISMYVYKTRQGITAGCYDDDSLLIPSIVIKAIIDLYNARKWDATIELCDKILTDAYRNYDRNVVWEIKYWECLAFCRNQDSDRFFKLVKDIKGADHQFLLGFFFRIKRDFDRAALCYEKALQQKPAMQRAKREMVKVLLSQKKYADALQLAEENYREQSENTYHVFAYYRCLIRKVNREYHDLQVLCRLIEEIENGDSPRRGDLAEAMQIEYDIFVKHADAKNILYRIDFALKEYPDSNDIKRVANEFRYRQRIDRDYIMYEEDV